ncbi:MAG: acyltransferase family protein [Eubacterium sp.]
MENKALQNRIRYCWVDNIKTTACILVVCGHFFMSMAANNLVPSNSVFHYFINTVYTFHVQLFFFCSGFLYQSSNKVHSIKSWGNNVIDKLINLGVPYFSFTVITLLLKIIFPDNITVEATPILKTLFIWPTAPYWYLYVLFFLYLIIPCMNSKKSASLLLAFSLTLKVMNIFLLESGIEMPYLIYSISGQLIWFSLGMLFVYIDFKKNKTMWKIISICFGLAAVVASIFICSKPSISESVKFIIGLLFVLFIVIISQFTEITAVNNFCRNFSKYFMPVFVMHTICAAGIRSLLFKMGIDSSLLHILIGLPAGFVFPVLIYKIMEKLPVFMFFVYPKKSISVLKSKHSKEKL